MRKLAGPVVVVVCALAAVGRATPLADPKPSNPGANFMFANRPGDEILGDDSGPYVNGIGGVTGQIYASGSGDATLNLFKTRPKRVFKGVYSPAEDVTQPPGAVVPSGTFNDGWFINIRDVWSMQIGGSQSTYASFSTGVGDFRWCGSGTTPAWCQGLTGSQQVSVTRTATNTWEVVAEAEINDLNLLVQTFRASAQIAGYYHMPFKLTITCTDPVCQ